MSVSERTRKRHQQLRAELHELVSLRVAQTAADTPRLGPHELEEARGLLRDWDGWIFHGAPTDLASWAGQAATLLDLLIMFTEAASEEATR